MSDNPTLYWNMMSPTCRAVKALIDIGKIPCKYVNVDLMKGEQKKPHILKLHPFGKIPFLVHGDLVVGQSGAIMVYLWETYKSIPRGYFGDSIEERARINQLLSWYQSVFRLTLFKRVVLLMGAVAYQKPIYQNQLDEVKTEIGEVMEKVNKLLQNKEYFANSQPTIIDLLFYFQIVDYIKQGEFTSGYSNIDKWFRNLYTIPAVKSITHQWFPMSEQLKKLFENVEVIKSSL